MNTKFKLLTLSASLLAAGLVLSTEAQANAYAVATNNIKDGFIFAGVDTNADGKPDTINTAAIIFGTPTSLSSSSATLNGTGTANSKSGPPAPDTQPSNGTGSNPNRTNEDTFLSVGGNTYYNLFGQKLTSYSGGDAIVVTEQSLTGTPIVARNIAESNVVGNGFGDADGRNISSTSLTLPITVTPNCGTTLSCAVSFSFKADPYIYAILDLLAKPGSVARGVLAFSITLTKVGDLIPTFAWAPNGAAGGIFGGTEVADAENLNLTREALTGGTSAEHSGDGILPENVIGSDYGADAFGTPVACGFISPFAPDSYCAYTAYLSTGDYTLSLSMIEKTDVKRIPEPASLALLGLGLAGLSLVRRRKQV